MRAWAPVSSGHACLLAGWSEGSWAEKRNDLPDREVEAHAAGEAGALVR